jgi:hypothetical protein
MCKLFVTSLLYLASSIVPTAFVLCYADNRYSCTWRIQMEAFISIFKRIGVGAGLLVAALRRQLFRVDWSETGKVTRALLHDLCPS